MASFKGVDYYNVADLFSEEEIMIRDTVREFVDKEVVPIIDAHAQAQTFPMELVPKMGELGLFGANLEGYGCAGLTSIAYGLIMQELERGDSGLRSFCSVQGALVMYPIYTFGSDEQKDRWLPKMATGEALGAFGLTEPDFGSNPGGMLTKAVKDGDDYIINGTKMWITNASIADFSIVWARLDEEDTYAAFIVETGAKGFSAPEMKGKWSLRASVTCELILEDVRVPAGNRLPKTPGLRAAFMCLNQARYGIAWGSVGAAMACYETALDYAKSRIQFDRPIASYQLVQRKLAHMLVEITKAQLICWRAGRLKDEGRLKHQQISLAKMNNVGMALDIARSAREVLGANGILDDYPVMRHMCNLETVNTYEGTYDIHTLILGNDITGIPAFN